MARYGKGGLSTNASIGNLGVDKPKQSLIRASAGFEGGMEGLVERAKEHNVGQWGHEAFGDNYYNDLKSDRGIGAYLASQARDGKYDPRVWQAERDEVEDTSDTPEPEPEEAAIDLSGISRNNSTDSARLASAKERSDVYRNFYTTSYDDNEAELPNEDNSEKAAASFMADYTLNLKDKLRNGTFNA